MDHIPSEKSPSSTQETSTTTNPTEEKPDQLPPYTDHTTHPTHTPSRRPGEDLLKSGDPSTAALRAWAADKQTQVPGSDGSFYLGQMSMGTGAVSGGPMFLPRKEFIVDPPMHEVDRLRAEEKGAEGKVEGEGGEKKRRGSVRDFIRRLSRGRKEEEVEKDEAPEYEKGGKGEAGEGSGATCRCPKNEEGDGKGKWCRCK